MWRSKGADSTPVESVPFVASAEDHRKVATQRLDAGARRRADPEHVALIESASASNLLPAPLAARRAHLVLLRRDDDVWDLLVADPLEHLLVERSRSDLTVDEHREEAQLIASREVALDHRLPL